MDTLLKALQKILDGQDLAPEDITANIKDPLQKSAAQHILDQIHSMPDSFFKDCFPMPQAVGTFLYPIAIVVPHLVESPDGALGLLIWLEINPEYSHHPNIGQNRWLWADIKTMNSGNLTPSSMQNFSTLQDWYYQVILEG